MKIKLLWAIVIFSLACAGLAQGGQRNHKKKKHRSPVKKIERVTAGTWGGDHISLEVAGNGATLDFDCASGTINGPMNVDGNGNFDVGGTFLREHPGPIRMGEDNGGKPARYSGHTDGNTMTLSVTLSGSSESLGTFSLRLGAPSRVRKCL